MRSGAARPRLKSSGKDFDRSTHGNNAEKFVHGPVVQGHAPLGPVFRSPAAMDHDRTTQCSVPWRSALERISFQDIAILLERNAAVQKGSLRVARRGITDSQGLVKPAVGVFHTD